MIVVEATGIANPMEILDGVTEAALYMKIDLKGVLTVVDSAHLLELYREQKGKTFRLMQEQIRAASCLILNKTDRVTAGEREELESVISRWNGYAPILPAVRCEVDAAEVLASLGGKTGLPESDKPDGAASTGLEAEDEERHSHSAAGHHHTHHDHVMVYTHYLRGLGGQRGVRTFCGRFAAGGIPCQRRLDVQRYGEPFPVSIRLPGA